MAEKKLTIFTDGGSRGNPGPAAIGLAFFDEKNIELYRHKECIGVATNNEAEYGAIIKALEILAKTKWLEENNHSESVVECRLDSQLVVEQLNGNYKIKQPHIQDLVSTVRDHLRNIEVKVEFVHIPREENKLADKLVNQALDEAKTQNSKLKGWNCNSK